MEIKKFEWDEKFEEQEDISFVILPEGDYPFTVTKMEKCIYNGSEKIPSGTNYAQLTLSVDGGELGKASCNTRIYLLGSFVWKIQAFLTSIGLRKHGDDVDLSLFMKCVGQSGYGHFSVTEGQKAGTKYNECDRFLEKPVVKEAETPVPDGGKKANWGNGKGW